MHAAQYTDLVELRELARQGKVRIKSQTVALDDVADVLEEVRAGRILGRAAFVPRTAAAPPP